MTEPVYVGPCAKCGGYHGGWQPCTTNETALAYQRATEVPPRREDAGDEKPMDYRHPLEMHHARREDAAGERVAQIAARLNAATPGPWEWKERRLNGGPANVVGVVSHGAAWDVAAGDAEFIAHSRSDIEYLLAALSTAERERDEARLDTKRLDWLFQNSWDSTVLIEMPERPGECQSIKLSRKAIDRARVPSGGEEGR